jgi:transposase
MEIPIAAPKALLADKGYDGGRFRESLLIQGILPIIPPRSNRKVPEHPDYRRYRDRNRVERMFGKLKQQRRIATRYDKTVLSFESFLNLAATRLWLKFFVNTAYSLDESERIIRALESSKNKGVLYDAPTMMLGLRQTPRYLKSGFDNAKLLVDTTAEAALAASPGTKGIYVCSFTKNCNRVAINSEELSSLINPKIAISRDMASNRAFKVKTDTAAAIGYIAAMNNPQIVTGVNKGPAQYLSEKMAAVKGIDVVRSNRADMRACISKSEPAFDLASCVKIGAQAAVYNIAQTGKPFVERNPLMLIRLPDY